MYVTTKSTAIIRKIYIILAFQIKIWVIKTEK